MQQIPFIDLFKSALHVLVDKLVHLQEHFLTVYTALVQCTDIAADRWQVEMEVHINLSKVGRNIGALYQSCIYSQKTASEDGQVCRPKHVEQIQIDQ